MLCAVRISEPIVFTQIFPYINEYINDLHVTDDPKRTGFYSGMVVRFRIKPSDYSKISVSNDPIGKYIRCLSTHVDLQLSEAFR